MRLRDIQSELTIMTETRPEIQKLIQAKRDRKTAYFDGPLPPPFEHKTGQWWSDVITVIETLDRQLRRGHANVGQVNQANPEDRAEA